MAKRRGNREGSLHWRARENRWRGEVLLDGERKYFYGATRAEVLEAIDKAKKLHAMGIPVGAGKEPLSKFLTRWLEDSVKARSRPRTYRLYKQQVNAHIIPALGGVALEKLTPQMVQQRLIAAQLAEGLAPRTVGHIRAVLRSALTQAEKWLLVPRNVVKLTEPPRRKKAQPTVFGADQVQTFIAAAEAHRLGPLFILMAVTGLRLGEALGLLWQHTDLDQRAISIRQAVQRIDLPDGTSELRVVEPKSDTSYRVVSIPASVVPVLVQHRATQNRERLLAGSRWQARGFVFTSTIGTPLDERNVRREFYGLLKAAKLPRIRLHDLRQHAGSRIMPGLSTERFFSHGRHEIGGCRFGIIRLLSCPRLVGREGGRHAGAGDCEMPHGSEMWRHRGVFRLVRRAPGGMWLRHCDDSVTAEAAWPVQLSG